VSLLAEVLDDKEALLEQYQRLHPVAAAMVAWQLGWLEKAHAHQIVPPGDWWSIWLMLAGRGAGKTRAAAETLAWWAMSEPGTRWLVAAPTSGDVRGTCFEGDSGLLSVIPPSLIADYNKSLHELTLVNGSFIKGIPASEPERFRGPQFHGAWCCIPGTMIHMADGSMMAIERIAIGDLVMTRHGPRTVLASGVSGNPSELVTIGCGDTSLTVTSDHPILVDDQWVPAGHIKSGDFVWATNTSAADTRTESFTSGTRDQSPKAGLFTTRMRTRATTTLTTLRQCREAVICACTQQAGIAQTFNAKPLPQRWSHCVLQSLHRVGNAAQRLSHALQVMLARSVHATVVSGGGATSSSQKNVLASSAPLSTSLPSDSNDIAASNAMPNPPCEPIALRQLEVQSVERSPNALTYSLTVEGEHEFIANGIVVHNCDELAAWEYLQDSWDMIMFGVRLGQRTRIICSTTPKPKPLIMQLLGREGDDVAVTKASTYVNVKNLAPSFQKAILQYEGTKLGRQEIHAEIIDPEEGGIVKRDWFRLWPARKAFPKLEFILQSYDCATSDKTQNDPTGSMTFGVFKPTDGAMSIMLLDCWQEHLRYPDLRPKVVEEFEVVYGEGRDRKLVDLILVEDKSAGISLIQDLQQAHLPVHAYNPGRADKIQRLSIVANIIKAGRVWIPESDSNPGFVKDWAEGAISQICSFPEGVEHDEFVDCISQALRYLRDGGWISIDAQPRDEIEPEDIDDAELYNRTRSRENPYSA
jgi:phage terminase large subunit-like protein